MNLGFNKKIKSEGANIFFKNIFSLKNIEEFVIDLYDCGIDGNKLELISPKYLEKL